MNMYLGLDVHSKQTVYHCQDEEGESVAKGAVPTTFEGLSDLVARLGLPEQTPIGLETGTQASWVYGVLKAHAMAPVVIEAGEVRAKARRRRQKTDDRDAFEICDGLRRGVFTRIVWVPDLDIQRLRDLMSRRRHFVGLRTSQINTVKFLLRQEGLPTAKVRLDSAIGWRRLAENEEIPAPMREFIAMHERIWLEVRECIKKLEAQIDDALEPFRDAAELLQTVPGVGPVTAAAFVAAIGDPHRFPTSAHVASYLGLVPSTYDSGESKRGGRITKEGNGALRACLCECAHQARRESNPLNPYYRRILAQKGYKRAVVAVAHRLARILYQIWKKKEAFDVNKLGVVRETIVHKRTTHYQLAKT